MPRLVAREADGADGCERGKPGRGAPPPVTGGLGRSVTIVVLMWGRVLTARACMDYIVTVPPAAGQDATRLRAVR
jgi:hypothetical protein